jgi:hypothetical protein
MPSDKVQASEEQVLSVYPTAIRRRILRFLYLKYLKVRVYWTEVHLKELVHVIALLLCTAVLKLASG